jgi:HSP20 family protein
MDYYWDPRREIREMRARVEQAFRCAQQQERVCRTAGQVVPLADFASGSAGFELSLDLPGVRREDLEIQIERGALVISGTKTLPETAGTVLRRERTYGTFKRALPLPDEADVSQVKASLTQGELKVTIGRKVEAGPRRVEISVE